MAKSNKPKQVQTEEEEQVEVVVQKQKPKRKCSEKQLAALAAGRAKNAEMRAKRKAEKEAVQAETDE